MAAAWTDWVDGVASGVQAAAIVVGGVWAYFKFLRGRTFAKRAEPTVTATRLPGDEAAVRVTATLKNVGLSKLPLRLAVLRVYEIAGRSGDDPVATRVRQLGKAQRVLEPHKWIEAGETVVDEAILRLPRDGQPGLLGYKIELKAIELRRNGGLGWTTSTVVGAKVDTTEERDGS